MRPPPPPSHPPQDTTNEGCRAATLYSCLKGESLCPALAFGSEANLESREEFAQ
jgi:hypothetical protein